MSTIADRRDRCRALQAQLAEVMELNPSPGEVTGALASELENLATFYSSMIPRLTVINPMLKQPIREVHLDELLTASSAQAKLIESLNIRSVPFAKESLLHMSSLVKACSLIEKWVEYDVSDRLARDFLGLHTNPLVSELAAACQKQKDSVDGLLEEAKHRHELKQLLQKAKVILDMNMTILDDPNARLSVLGELERILANVSADLPSLSEESIALAQDAEIAAQLITLYDEADKLAEKLSSSFARLRGRMPTDPSPSLHAVDQIREFCLQHKISDLSLKKDDIINVAVLLRDCWESVKLLRVSARGVFPRLCLLEDDDVESLLGGGAPQCNAALKRWQAQLFNRWQQLDYSLGGNAVVSIRGEGEVLTLDRPVEANEGIPIEVFLSNLVQSTKETLRRQISTAGNHAHKVAIGAEEFRIEVFTKLSCQAALVGVHVLWTSLVEGTFRPEDESTLSEGSAQVTQPSVRLSRPSSAASRLQGVTKPLAGGMNTSDLRPGSASPSLFKRPGTGASDKKPQVRKGSTPDTLPLENATQSYSSPARALRGFGNRSEKEPLQLHDDDESLFTFMPLIGGGGSIDRKLSCVHTPNDVAEILTRILSAFAAEKMDSPIDRRWWFDNVIAFLYRLYRMWDEQLRLLPSGDAAWLREPRAYFSKSASRVDLSLGPLTLEHQCEFFGNMSESFVLTAEHQESWSKLASAIVCEIPTVFTGVNCEASIQSLGKSFGQFCPQFASNDSVGFRNVETFLNGCRRVSNSLPVLCNVDSLSHEVQCQLGTYLTNTPMALCMTALSAESLHPRLSRVTRTIHMSGDSEGFLLEVCFAANGMSEAPTLARKLLLLLATLDGVCKVKLGMTELRRAIECAGRSIMRDKSSTTPELSLFYSLRNEVEPLVPILHKEFFATLGRGLFSAESSTTVFPQIVQSARSVAGRTNKTECSDQLLRALVDLYAAVVAAPSARCVVAVAGSQGCGRTTAINILKEVVVECSDGIVPRIVSIGCSGEDEAIIDAIVAAVHSSTSTAPSWIVLTGVFSSRVLHCISEQMEVQPRSAVFLCKTEAAGSPESRCYPRTVVVVIEDAFNTSSWMPRVKARIAHAGFNSKAKLVLISLFEKHFDNIVEFSAKSSKQTTPITGSRKIQNVLCLLETFAAEVTDDTHAEKVFWFAATWGAAFMSDNCAWTNFVSDSASATLSTELASEWMHDVFVTEVGAFAQWRACGVSIGTKALKRTNDIISAVYVGSRFLKSSKRIAICGPAGCGKTLLANELIKGSSRVSLRSEQLPASQALSRVVVDNCDLAHESALINLRSWDCAEDLGFVSREIAPMVNWMPTVILHAEANCRDLPRMLFQSQTKLTEAYTQGYQAIQEQSNLRTSVGSLQSFVSLAQCVDGLDDSPPTTTFYSLAFQHLIQRAPECAENLDNALSDAFGAVDKTKSVVFRDSSGQLSTVTPEDALQFVKDSMPSHAELVTIHSLSRIAALTWMLSSCTPHVLVQDAASSQFYGDALVEATAACALLGTVVRKVTSLAELQGCSDVLLCDSGLFQTLNDFDILDKAILKGSKIIIDNIGARHDAARSLVVKHFSHRLHHLASFATVEDVKEIASSCIENTDFAHAVAEMHFNCASTVMMSTKQFYDAISDIDAVRKEMERSYNENLDKISSVIRLLRRVEIAASGKSIVPPQEQNFAVKDEITNRAFEGRIYFNNVPPKPFRLIAQFNINTEEMRLVEVAAPSVFFGTSREDVVAIPAVNGGTCRSRCDGKGLSISTGMLDFLLVLESVQPIAFSGTVTDPAAGNAIVGKVKIRQVVETEGNVINKKWLRFGNSEPTEAEDFLTKPLEVPSEAMLGLNRSDADRYISKVGNMAKLLQAQLEQSLLQKQFLECAAVPGHLAGRTLIPLLLQMPAEERDVIMSRITSGTLPIENPLALKGLASLLKRNLYETELWLVKQRQLGLPYGTLAEQNACGLRYFIERQKSAACNEDDEDEGRVPTKPVAVIDADHFFTLWALSYCKSEGVDVRVMDAPSEEDLPSSNAVLFAKQLSVHQKLQWNVIETKLTQASLTSQYQMIVARPEPGSTQDASSVAALQAALDSRSVVDNALDALLTFLHDQYEVAESQSSVVTAIVEIGKEKVPALMDAIKKTKDTIGAADAYVDRQGSRWKNVMENALPHGERVAILHAGSRDILRQLSPSYVLSMPLAAVFAKEALSVNVKSTQGTIDAATKSFVSNVVQMLRLEHRLEYCIAVAAILASNGNPVVGEVLAAMREVDPRETIKAERKLRMDAAAAYDEWKSQQVQSTASGARAPANRQQQQQKRELKDFLSPEVKPQYNFLTYQMWSNILCLSKTCRSLSNLPASLQHAEPVGNKGISRQEKWADWVQNPSIGSIPTYEKDPTVSALDKLLLLHVIRPEKTQFAMLQLVSEVLGSEIPDPFAFDDFSSVLSTMKAKAVIVYRASFFVDLCDAAQAAAQQRLDAKKSKLGTVDSLVVTVHSESSDLAAVWSKCTASDTWLIVEDVDCCSVERSKELLGLVAAIPEAYQGVALLVCGVKDPDAPREQSPLLLSGVPRIACNEPSSIRARMSRYYTSGKTLIPQRGNNHRVMFLLNFLVAAVSQRCRFQTSAFSDPKRLASIDGDLSAASMLLNRQLPSFSARQWDEVRSLVSSIIGTNVSDPRDKGVIAAFIDWLIHPEVINSNQVGFLQLPAAATLSAHLDAVAALASIDSAEQVGLHANEERRYQESEGRRLMAVIERLLAPAVTPATIVSAASNVIARVPPLWSPSELIAVRSASRASALSKLLCEEVETLQRIVAVVRSELDSAVCTDAAAVKALTPLAINQTPRHWLLMTHHQNKAPQPADCLGKWIDTLANRHNQLLLWARHGTPRILSVGLLAHISGLLSAYVYDTCVSEGLDGAAYRAKLSVLPNTNTKVLPEMFSNTPLSEGLYLIGGTIEGATVNSRGIVQEPPDFNGEWWKDTLSPLPLVLLSIERPPADCSLLGSRQGQGLTRIQEAITFSRANAALTTSRPSSASCGSPISLRSSFLKVAPTGQVPVDNDDEAQQRLPPYAFVAPVYKCSLRRQEDYICDLTIPSYKEHNFWMMRGAAVLLSPSS